MTRNITQNILTSTHTHILYTTTHTTTALYTAGRGFADPGLSPTVDTSPVGVARPEPVPEPPAATAAAADATDEDGAAPAAFRLLMLSCSILSAASWRADDTWSRLVSL